MENEDVARTDPTREAEPRALRVARWCGISAQALVLGTLLAFAVVRLIAMAGGAVVFRYQGF
jgi:hypothetical protein